MSWQSVVEDIIEDISKNQKSGIPNTISIPPLLRSDLEDIVDKTK